MDLSYDANLAEIFETIAMVVLPAYVAVQKRLLLAESCPSYHSIITDLNDRFG